MPEKFLEFAMVCAALSIQTENGIDLCLRDCAARYFPDGAGETLALKACLYTNTPDRHFIVDHLPEYPQIVIGGGFSGHGFKFCSVMGEILADLALTGTTPHAIGAFRLARFM